MTVHYVERFINGARIVVPAIDVHGITVVVTGRWLRQAHVDAEECTVADLNAPQIYIDSLRRAHQLGCPGDVFTFTHKVSYSGPPHPYPMELESVAAIRLTTFADWWDRLPQVVRKNVRRSAKRGVETRLVRVDDELIRGIVAINNETPIRQGKHFTHYGERFEDVTADFLSFADRSDVIGAYLDNHLIGVTKLIYRGNVAALMKLQTTVSHADDRAADALIAKAVERCSEHGVSHITYGLYRYGNQNWTSLMEFKARHGFEEILVPRYYVPLSLKGELACRLKLHRGIVGVLPARAVQAGRALRARWTSRFFAGVAQR